ncbi:putative ABC transporter ATP-binding protein [uncultured archaeon]|nr:putative ABC transporter ATP-binding protein [uncultured archaeon]
MLALIIQKEFLGVKMISKKTGNKEHKDEIIRLDNISKTYRMGESVVRAVSDASLMIKKGEFVAIVGPSGSGKSTMMNMVGALDLASKGEIFLDGIDIEHITESQLAQIRGRRIGFIFQTFNLIPTLNALENVSLPMIFQGIPKWKRTERAKQLLKEVKLEHRMYHLPSELSGGERQRVAIARALANDPEVILADEPTGNLDSKTGEEILNMFIDLNKKGKTIIMITHDNNLAKKAEKIIRIKDGQIVKAQQ